jgi:tRNA pseudouridine13 synthase
MKLKQQPEDFRVEELTDVTPGPEGPFAFYRLEKRGWTTPDAIQAIRRRWQLDLGRLSYGGLKDRHAWTIQYLTIFHGPKHKLTHHTITLEFLGQVFEPFQSRHIRSNRFHVTLRALTEEDVRRAQLTLEEIRVDGIPNYFDDQRFGSVRSGGDFVGKAIVLGQYEKALKLALTEAYEFDRAARKKEKAILRAHWGNWAACKAALSRGHARSLIDYLVHHPDDFRGALARLRPELRGLYLSAYQSHLWNKMLARRLRELCRSDQLISIRFRQGEVPMVRGLDEAQRMALTKLRLPLPAARVQMDPEDPGVVIMDAVIAEEGLERDQFKLKGFKEMFFSKGDRAAICLPVGLQYEFNPDDSNPGKFKLEFCCELPRGSYVTLLVKRIQSGRSS